MRKALLILLGALALSLGAAVGCDVSEGYPVEYADASWDGHQYCDAGGDGDTDTDTDTDADTDSGADAGADASAD